MSGKFHSYKGYPLVRCGDQLYYGYMSDPYVIWIQVLETKEQDGEKLISKVNIIQMDTRTADPLKAFVKNSKKECDLYEALDVGKVWLDKALKA
ncbi:MAG: hypothetical protein IJ874_10135 [Ruminococcus sp.]|nr:hypothetical protein [Ruminococcus sp.]